MISLIFFLWRDKMADVDKQQLVYEINIGLSRASGGDPASGNSMARRNASEWLPNPLSANPMEKARIKP